MYLSTSTSDRGGAASVPTERQPLRAGLRVPPSGEQPNGVFVVVEMVVLVIVAALAMASIIVSGGGADDAVQAASAAAQPRPQTARDAGASLFAGPSAHVGERADASATQK